MNRALNDQVRVRKIDGAVRPFYEASQPALAVDQKVRATKSDIAAIG